MPTTHLQNPSSPPRGVTLLVARRRYRCRVCSAAWTALLLVSCSGAGSTDQPVQPTGSGPAVTAPIADTSESIATVGTTFRAIENVRYRVPGSEVSFVVRNTMRATLVTGEHISSADLEVWVGSTSTTSRISSSTPLSRGSFEWRLEFCDFGTADFVITPEP